MRTAEDPPAPRYEGVPVARAPSGRNRRAPPLDFARALAALKAGRRVARATWDGASLRQVASAPPAPPLTIAFEDRLGGLQPGWSASADDLLAEDWRVLAG